MNLNQIGKLLKDFKIKSTITDYKNNIGGNVHMKQIEFCEQLTKEFYNNENDKITVNTNRCGIGKTTVIKCFLDNLVNNYTMFGQINRDHMVEEFGAIVITDSLEGLNKISNYENIKDRCYLMQYDKEDTESMAKSKKDFQKQLKEQYEYPIILLTTQKYFKMSKAERNNLYNWRKGKRNIKIIDEKPYIFETITIDEVYLSNINIALEEIIKCEDKTYLLSCWRKIRNDLDYIRDSYSDKYDIMWISKVNRPLLLNKTEDKKFFEILANYINTETYDKIEKIKEIYNNGCLFVSSSDKGQDNKRQFVLLHNNLNKFDNEKCKCFILDATSKFDIDYKADPNIFEFLYIDDEKENKDINIHHVLTSTSQKALLKDNNNINTICKWINETIGQDGFVTTYSKRKGIYQKFENGLNTKDIEYFGNIKGKNDWEHLENMIHVGLNRKSNIVYLEKYILLNGLDELWNTLTSDEIEKEINALLEVDKGLFVNEMMNNIMISDLTVDTIQNIMRIKCRHFSNKDKCNIFIVCSKYYERIVTRVANAVGAYYIPGYTPDIFQEQQVMNRKPIEGKKETNPQKFLKYINSLEDGKVLKMKDIIEGSKLTSNQLKEIRKSNQICKKWFNEHKGEKRGQYII